METQDCIPEGGKAAEDTDGGAQQARQLHGALKVVWSHWIAQGSLQTHKCTEVNEDTEVTRDI